MGRGGETGTIETSQIRSHKQAARALRGKRQQESSILSQFVTSIRSARPHLGPQIPDCMHAGWYGTFYCGPRVTVQSSKEECTAVLPAVWRTP